MPTDLEVRCICGHITLSVFAQSQSPFEVGMCHCSDCRHTTGAVSTCWIPLVSPLKDTSGLIMYAASERARRFFCAQCGAHCFLEMSEIGEGDGELVWSWCVAAGLVERGDIRSGDEEDDGKKEELVRVIEHDYVSSTGDGGIAGRLTRIAGRDIPCYTGDPTKGSLLMKPAPQPPLSDHSTAAIATKSSDDRLRISCHCNGVDFYLLRPQKRGYPMEDFWLKGHDTKYIAKFCVCESCRRALGFQLQPWTYAPRSEIVAKDGSPLDFNSGTLRVYESSPGVFRHFCGTCGATVFYRSDGRAEENGYDLVDISVGLVRVETGVRAEEWLEWHFENISHRRDAVEVELVDAIADGP